MPLSRTSSQGPTTKPTKCPGGPGPRRGTQAETTHAPEDEASDQTRSNWMTTTNRRVAPPMSAPERVVCGSELVGDHPTHQQVLLC